MAEWIKIAENIHDEIKHHERIVGRMESDLFSMENDLEIQKFKIESPIEQLILSAMKCVFRVNAVLDYRRQDGVWQYQINPQFEIGRYRVDFLVRYFYPENILDSSSPMLTREVIVECDSQEFHERTESERRYEKARDRFLQKAGYKVFRFTGKEILQDALSVSSEIISYLINETKENTRNMAINYED